MANDDVTGAALESDVNPGSEAENVTDTDNQDTQDTGSQGAQDDGAQGEKEVVPDWSDDWREKIANTIGKGDEKLLKRLNRFKSPADITKSWLAMEQRLSSGEMKQTLPDDPSDKQIAEYRKANGIPETPDGYLENLPDGLVIGDADKELVGSYIERVHGKNADPAVVAETLNWYYDLQEEAIAKQSESDKAQRQDFEDTLRQEWGGEYRANINSIKAFLDTAPTADDGTSLRTLLEGSRFADGTPIGNHPTMLRWLAQMADQANPAGFVAPGAGMTQLQTVEDEIKEIEGMMRKNRTAYNKDEKMQERYRVLLAAKEKLAAA